MYEGKNGTRFERGIDGSLHVETKTKTHAFRATVADDFSDFFQQENDEEFGRFRRSPRDVHVIYPTDDSDKVNALDEARCEVIEAQRGIKYGDGLLNEVIQDYFDHHPTPQPWHDAEDGDVWMVRIPKLAETHIPAIVVPSLWPTHDDMYFQFGDRLGSPSRSRVDSPDVADAYRIWPKGGQQ